MKTLLALSKSVLLVGPVMILLILWFLSGCALITSKVAPGTKTDQVVYSEAGGISSLLTGKVSRCTILRSSDTAMEIVSFVFDEDTCAVELKRKDNGTD